MNAAKIVTLLSTIILLGLILTAVVWNKSDQISVLPYTTTTPEPTESPTTTTKHYESTQYGFSFFYPNIYYLLERTENSSTNHLATVVLALDTEENRAVLEGRATEPREGPPTVTIDVYSNPQQRSPEAWITNATTWATRTQEATATTVNGQPALTYNWSGLYEGTSTILTHGSYAYVISGSWLSDIDPLATDYHTILGSFRFTE